MLRDLIQDALELSHAASGDRSPRSIAQAVLTTDSFRITTLNRAREIGLKEGLDFVYLGNVPGHPGENTWCPKCGKALVTRVSYQIDASGLKNGACRHCGRPIPGVWT